MLGLEGDAIHRTLAIRPHLPQTWNIEFANYRVGKTIVSGSIHRSKGEARVSLNLSGEPLDVTISPAFAPGAALISAEVNGKESAAQSEATSGDTHFTMRTGAAQAIEALIRVNEPLEAPPVLPLPLPGDPTPAHR